MVELERTSDMEIDDIEVSLKVNQVCLVDSNLIGGMREGILGLDWSFLLSPLAMANFSYESTMTNFSYESPIVIPNYFL